MKKVYRAIKFNQNACRKPYIDIIIDLRKKAKNDFENRVFGITMENVKKQRDIKLFTTKRRRNYFVSELNYATKFFAEKLSILELSKILMCEFWYDYVKQTYAKKAKLCYMNADSFIVYIKTNDIYKDIAEDAEIRFDFSNDELDKPLPKGKNKKVITLMKDELSKKTMTKFIGL